MEIPQSRTSLEEPLQVARLAIWDAESDKFVVAKRADNGLLEFPGGKCDRGELRAQGAVRETLEEVGLEVVLRSPFRDYVIRQMDPRLDREEYAGREYRGSIALAAAEGGIHKLGSDGNEVAASMLLPLSEIEALSRRPGKTRDDMCLMLPVVRQLMRTYIKLQDGSASYDVSHNIRNAMGL